MAINKKLIHFKKKESFDTEAANNNILGNSIVFINDSREISTHKSLYKTVYWGTMDADSPQSPVLENFIYIKSKSLFTELLEASNILEEAVVFIEDTKEIWNHGTFFATQLSKEELEGYIASSETVNGLIGMLGSKQDGIEDLDDIRAGAALGMTAVQESGLAGYLTKSEQSLTEEEKTQVRSNLGMMYSTATSTTDYPSVTIK